MTAIAKIREAIVRRGEELTAAQLKARYGTVKPRQMIYQLRNEGYDITRFKSVDTKGRVTYKYTAR